MFQPFDQRDKNGVGLKNGKRQWNERVPRRRVIAGDSPVPQCRAGDNDAAFIKSDTAALSPGESEPLPPPTESHGLEAESLLPR